MSLVLALLAAVHGLDSTRVKGTAVAMASGRPLAGVQVTVGSSTVTTDTTGAFTLTVPAGARPILGIVWSGRSETVRNEEVDLAKPVVVVVDTEAANGRPLVQQADWRLPGVWGVGGFFARRSKGYGEFFDRADFRAGGFATLKDLLASEGVTQGCARYQGCGPVAIANGRKVLMDVWIDGVVQTTEEADSLSLDQVAAVEVYPRLTIPRPAAVSPDRKWILDTRYFLGEPLRGGMVIVWTRGYDGPTR